VKENVKPMSNKRYKMFPHFISHSTRSQVRTFAFYTRLE